jgi:hypothetical protein
MGSLSKVIAHDVILLQLYVDWFSNGSNDEMSETETLDTDVAITSSGDWLWLCPVFVSDSESCRTDEDEIISCRTSFILMKN